MFYLSALLQINMFDFSLRIALSLQLLCARWNLVFVNATLDEDGQINEAVSPGDCTDLCSTIDEKIGSFVKAEFNKAFMIHFKADLDRWAEGRISARERRKLFTVWTCDAVEALMKRRDIILRAFRGTGVGINVEGKERGSIRFPGFETYVPPENNEEHNDDPITKSEFMSWLKLSTSFRKRRELKKWY